MVDVWLMYGCTMHESHETYSPVSPVGPVGPVGCWELSGLSGPPKLMFQESTDFPESPERRAQAPGWAGFHGTSGSAKWPEICQGEAKLVNTHWEPSECGNEIGMNSFASDIA